MGQFPFSTADSEYDPNTSKNIVFKKKEYILTNPHSSIYHLKTGDQVLVTRDGVYLRYKPTSASSGKPLSKNTNLIIQGNAAYDESVDSSN
ncbi:hypothetical protein [Bacillus toyonensis]|uniref:hypothetical protein n=1 Tax=Bacillus toyonensis TaxID=155322 RepID=UPI00211D1D7E|nr:hypothetical protein [Bacillus toyonensis]